MGISLLSEKLADSLRVCTNPYIRVYIRWVLWLLPNTVALFMRTCRFIAYKLSLNRRFQPCIFCYDFPKTAKVVGKHTKKGRNRHFYSIII